MAETPAVAVSDAPVPESRGSVLGFLRLARGFWSGPTAQTAWLLCATVFAILLVNLAINVGFNRWNRWFYDALEKKDGKTLATAVLAFLALIVIGAAFAVAMARSRMTLQLAWRAWVTDTLLARWLSEQKYYKLAVSDEGATAPESRITDDVRLATEPVVDFATGFVNAVLSAVTFASILFVVGGSIQLPGVTIPGYIALAALGYALVMSLSTFLIGRPLASAVDHKNEAEAQFRFGLTRIRENVESIALIRGDDDELRRSREGFAGIAASTREVIRNHCNLTWILNANAFFAGTFALLLAVPKYLTGELTLGQMMQIGSAFTAVLGALNWFAENFIPVAQWRASARRVSLLDDAFNDLAFDEPESGAANVAFTEGVDGAIALKNVSLRYRNGRAVVDSADVAVQPGERVLLAGESGSGKSTLIRAIAGLWPWGSGEISLPRGARIGFVPQRPYIPRGTLRDALAYPLAGSELDPVAARKALEDAGLGYLVETLEAEAQLDQTLSGGERQRIAFARLFLQKPTVIVMDEATAALDVESETRLLTLLFERFPEATVLSVGHRPGLESLHTRRIALKRTSTGARIDANAPARRWGRWKRKGPRRRMRFSEWGRGKLRRFGKREARASAPASDAPG